MMPQVSPRFGATFNLQIPLSSPRSTDEKIGRMTLAMKRLKISPEMKALGNKVDISTLPYDFGVDQKDRISFLVTTNDKADNSVNIKVFEGLQRIAKDFLETQIQFKP